MIDILRPLLITALVVVEVGLWQWRVVIASRGSRSGPVALGALGAVLQITAISQVVMNVTDPLSVAAYATGVGAGVLLGLLAGDRLSPGSIGVTVVTDNPDLVDELWARGWPATSQPGCGENGPVTVLSVVINRRHESRLHRDVAELAPDALWSAKDQRKRPAAARRAVGVEHGAGMFAAAPVARSGRAHPVRWGAPGAAPAVGSTAVGCSGGAADSGRGDRRDRLDGSGVPSTADADPPAGDAVGRRRRRPRGHSPLNRSLRSGTGSGVAAQQGVSLAVWLICCAPIVWSSATGARTTPRRPWRCTAIRRWPAGSPRPSRP